VCLVVCVVLQALDFDVGAGIGGGGGGGEQMATGQTLPDIALQPDSYRGSGAGDWSASLHFADAQVNAYQINYSIDCVGGCVLTAIYNYTDILVHRRANICMLCKS
jgi:hypothetical protein